jgi:hypothetical protein
MSNHFEDVKISWAGIDYTIPAHKMMGAIARIEDHVTMPELQRFGERQTVPMTRLASAFASVLRYAGATKVTDEDVYAAMFSTDGNAQEAMAEAITVLLGMMVPRNVREKFNEAVAARRAETGDDSGNSQTTGQDASSKRRSSSVAARNPGGARSKSSGTSRRKSSIG